MATEQEGGVRRTWTPKYGYGVTRTSADGAERTMELVEFHDDAEQLSYGLVMTTKWPGLAEPVQTKTGLSVEGLGMLTDLLSNAHNLHDYPLGEV